MLYLLEQIDSKSYRRDKSKLKASVPAAAGFFDGSYRAFRKRVEELRKSVEAREVHSVGLQVSELPPEIARIAAECMKHCGGARDDLKIEISGRDRGLITVVWDPAPAQDGVVETTLLGATVHGCPPGKFLPSGTVFPDSGDTRVIPFTRTGMQDVEAVICVNGDGRLLRRAFSPGDREVSHLRVVTRTGSHKHAGNKGGRIQLRVLGVSRQLDNPRKNDFEPGSVDEFVLPLQKGTWLGQLRGSTSVLENRDYKKKGRGWHCASIEIQYKLRGTSTFHGFEQARPGWLDDKYPSTAGTKGRFEFRLV